jgi:hypothetical protein
LAIGGRGKTKLRAISAGAVNLSSYSIIIGGFADKVDTTLRRTVCACDVQDATFEIDSHQSLSSDMPKVPR